MKRSQGVAALIAGVVLVLALLTVFAIELSDNQSSSRKSLETQAHQQAVLVSGLMDAVFAQSSHIGPRARARYSAAHVTTRELDGSQGNNAYVVVLSGSGAVLGHSSGFTARDRQSLDTTAAVRAVSSGQSWWIGDVLPGNVIDISTRIDTPHGPRVLVTGLRLSSLSAFIASELNKVPGVTSQHQLVVDGNGVVLGSTVADRPAGYRFHTASQLKALAGGSGIVHSSQNGVRYFDSVPVANTRWKLLLSVPTNVFFASVSGFRRDLPWVIFGAFGAVALAALLLVRRSIREAVRIRRTNAELSATNAELSATQQSLEEVNDTLAVTNSALERSNDELERQARELVRSNTELDQFASIASHDLQEPLRKVRTFTERISETEASNLTERGADYLRRANASAERMQTLIEDLLRFSRVSTQGRPFTSVDLNAVARDVLDDLSAQVEREGATVTIGPLPTINADASQMRQLLQNLISNALKFQREDVPSRVDVDATVDSGWMTLVVKDNGIGFDPQYSRRIFRVFERLHGRGTYPGTGIGLALCRKIAERHGGTIVAVGVPGESATFTVTMQTERTEAVSDAPAPSRATDPSTGGSTDREEPYVTA
jgi:signal transduction histidine kinase